MPVLNMSLISLQCVTYDQEHRFEDINYIEKCIIQESYTCTVVIYLTTAAQQQRKRFVSVIIIIMQTIISIIYRTVYVLIEYAPLFRADHLCIIVSNSSTNVLFNLLVIAFVHMITLYVAGMPNVITN
jgi:hypothetical protein